jgi:hypothetical protein
VQSVYFHKAEGCQGKKIFKYNFAHWPPDSHYIV